MLNLSKNKEVSHIGHLNRLGGLVCGLVCLFGLITVKTLWADDRPVTPTQLPVVYIDWQNTSVEDGSQVHPFNTIAKGISAVSNGGTLVIHADRYGEMLTLNRPMTLQSEGGITTIDGIARSHIYKIYLPFLTFR